MSGTASSPKGSVTALRRSLRLVARAPGRDEREFLPAALEIIETPASPIGRGTALVICAAAVFAIGWSAVGKVDVIVSTPGQIVPVGRSKIVQPLEAGIVQAILVADGQMVRQGQPLIRLNLTVAKANQERAASELLQAELDRSRFSGLSLTTDNPPKPPLLINVPANATPAQVTAVSSRMLAAAAAEASKITDLDQQIAEKRGDIAQAQAEIARVNAEWPYLSQVATMRTRLYRAQVGTKLDWLRAEQALAETGPSLAKARSEEESATASVSALQAERASTMAAYREKTLQSLEKSVQDVDQFSEELAKADQAVHLDTLRAPITGTVQQLAVHTIGGVVTPAEQLMVVVPANPRLMMQGEVSNEDIGTVHVGQTVQVKISTFDFTRYGTIKGKVLNISQDAQVNGADQSLPQTGTDMASSVGKHQNDLVPQRHFPGYTVEIALEHTTITTDHGPQLLEPGMAVTADIKTGRRTIFSYLLSPLEETAQGSLRKG